MATIACWRRKIEAWFLFWAAHLASIAHALCVESSLSGTYLQEIRDLRLRASMQSLIFTSLCCMEGEVKIRKPSPSASLLCRSDGFCSRAI